MGRAVLPALDFLNNRDDAHEAVELAFRAALPRAEFGQVDDGYN